MRPLKASYRSVFGGLRRKAVSVPENAARARCRARNAATARFGGFNVDGSALLKLKIYTPAMGSAAYRSGLHRGRTQRTVTATSSSGRRDRVRPPRRP